MSTFTGLGLENYQKRLIPRDEQSRVEYLDEQLRRIERSIGHLNAAVEQLQDEMALIWTELVALGRTRP